MALFAKHYRSQIKKFIQSQSASFLRSIKINQTIQLIFHSKTSLCECSTQNRNHSVDLLAYFYSHGHRFSINQFKVDPILSFSPSTAAYLSNSYGSLTRAHGWGRRQFHHEEHARILHLSPLPFEAKLFFCNCKSYCFEMAFWKRIFVRAQKVVFIVK